MTIERMWTITSAASTGGAFVLAFLVLCEEAPKSSAWFVLVVSGAALAICIVGIGRTMRSDEGGSR